MYTSRGLVLTTMIVHTCVTYPSDHFRASILAEVLCNLVQSVILLQLEAQLQGT